MQLVNYFRKGMLHLGSTYSDLETVEFVKCDPPILSNHAEWCDRTYRARSKT